MESYFFKKCGFFDFNANKYDVGKPFWFRKSHSDMQFLIKIVELNSSEYLNLYNHHKTYYLNNHSGSQEKVFFKELFTLVNRNKSLELRKNPTKMGPRDKSKWEQRIKKYESFLKILKSKDDWELSSDISEGLKNIHKNIKAKQDIEELLRKENIELQKELKELKLELSKYRVKPEHKIEIIDDNRETIIDLFHQMQKLPHWKSNKTNDLLVTHSQNTWAKIMTNYFKLGNEDISFNTVRKHFKDDEIGKYSKNRHYVIKNK